MKKIEIIWRELLYQAIEKKTRQFSQKNLAKKFGFSTSTVFQALKAPRKMGAVRVTGRFFVLEDPEKLLYHWASSRNLKKDIIFSARVELPIFEIEGEIPANVIFGGYTAARQILKEAPADYDRVFVYAQVQSSKFKIQSFLKDLKTRFTLVEKSQNLNLIILKGDPFLKNYGERTTLAQTFVDLWNLEEWYAKEFVNSLKKKINELL
jgi:DNA-binding transcriptional MocR family regulator